MQHKNLQNNRIEQTLDALATKGEKALALFMTAGYPELHSTVNTALALEKGGADIVELGMPFSDPLADGPVIQESSTAAIRNGMTLARLLENVGEIRSRSQVPIVLMGYLNPILRFGVEKFFETAEQKGVDGLILPELPLEETGRFGNSIRSCGLAQILLVTPTTPTDRIRAIDLASSGFLYCVSTTGVTGAEGNSDVQNYIRNVKKNAVRNRVLVGFGIARPDDAVRYSRDSDGVIIGTALIKKLREGLSGSDLTEWVRQFKEALRKGDEKRSK